MKWVEMVRATLSYNTLKNYKSVVNRFLWYAQMDQPHQITSAIINNYIIKLHNDGKNNRCIQTELKCISVFCQHLVSAGFLTADPVKSVKMPKCSEAPKYCLEGDEAEQVLNTARDKDLYLEVFFALKTGMRVSEIRVCKWEDIYWQKKLIIIPKSKTHRPRAIPLHSELTKLLLPIKQKSGYIFPDKKRPEQAMSETWWAKAVKSITDEMPDVFRCGLSSRGPGRGWHRFRATVATQLAESGASIFQIARILGHTNIKTTMKYITIHQSYDDVIEKL